MATFDFDRVIDRRGTQSAKYDIFDDPDLISMWVADMDFESPEAIRRAIAERLEHNIFGYTLDSPQLREVICTRMERLYDWQVQPEEIVFIPGVVAALNAAMRAVGEPGDSVLIQPPVYPPFLASPAANRMRPVLAPLTEHVDGARLHYAIDFDAFAAAIEPDTKLFALCSPHNPVGRVWTPDELRRMAEICIARDVVICSDEIHCDLVFDGHPHTPMAALSPEIARHMITLMAPSKTYNIPSLGFSFAIIQNETLRQQFQQAESFIVPHVGVLGFAAALGAYTGGDEWLAAALDYMQTNRDIVTDFVEEHLPGVRTTHPEGTYLSWLDVRDYDGGDGPAEGFTQWVEPFFLHNASVALNKGALFGTQGIGYARLNFALPRARLNAALDRMRAAVAQAAR
ncbi:MAG: MalY/PatB family protein [Chloroflexota bacterium]